MSLALALPSLLAPLPNAVDAQTPQAHPAIQRQSFPPVPPALQRCTLTAPVDNTLRFSTLRLFFPQGRITRSVLRHSSFPRDSTDRTRTGKSRNSNSLTTMNNLLWECLLRFVVVDLLLDIRNLGEIKVRGLSIVVIIFISIPWSIPPVMRRRDSEVRQEIRTQRQDHWGTANQSVM